MELQKTKNTVSEMKISLENTSKLDAVEQEMSEHEYLAIETILREAHNK